MSKILIDEALRLADALEDTDGAHDHEDAAAELRRLHAENQALRQALKQPAPPECKTEAEKTAFAFGWFKALESVREEKEPDPDELTIAYMSGVYEGKKSERKRILNLLMIQHEAANGAHNYWKVAANLIQADVASDT